MEFAHRFEHTFVMAFLVGMLAGAPQLALAVECPAERQPRIPQPMLPLNIDKIKKQLRDYQSEDYSGDIADALADARAFIEARAGQVKNPTLILDIDETSLSNWPNIAADDFGFIPDGPCNLLPKGPCGFNAWVRKHAAEAITPTRILFNAAKANGVAVFFITSRHEVDRNVTTVNLHRAKYEGWKKLILRADNDTKRTVQDFKTEERSKIAAEGYSIIANVGDQRSDLDGGFAECTFKVPNPFYFIR